MADLEAALNYLVPQAEPLHTYAFDPPDGGPRFNGRLESRTVRIEDARRDPARFRLAQTGFELVAQPSRVRDFFDEQEVRETYFREAEALVCAATGLSHACVFDHTLRRRVAATDKVDGVGGSFAALREPVGRVHADFTPRSAPVRIRRDCPEAVANQALSGDYLIVGLWRSIGPEPVGDAPLAITDARTLAACDLVPNALVYPERRGETYAITFDPGHRWYYFSDQVRDEALVFVHYDSRRAVATGSACTGAAAHTAFDHPGRTAATPPRESIELRIVVW